MFCTKCGAEVLVDAEFCQKCGRPLVAARPESPNQPPRIADTAAASTSNATKSASVYKWASAFGWLFVLAGLYLWIIALMTFSTGKELTHAALPSGSAKSIGVGAGLIQALVFGATGLTIIRRKKIAATLIWVSVALSGLGVLARGLVPLDIFLWIAVLGLTVWYKKKAPLLLKAAELQPTSKLLAGRTNSWLDREGVGLAVVFVVAILFLVSSLASLGRRSDRQSGSRPTSDATAIGEHTQNPNRNMTPGESKVIQTADLMTLRLKEVIARCGRPRTDTTRAFKEATIKGLLRRDLSYENAKGSVVTLSFWSGTDQHDWNFLVMLDGGVEYRAEDSDHILSTLPCIGE
jgi:hypothetical protein